MPCYNPIQAYQPNHDQKKLGYKKIIFNPRPGQEGESIKIPCKNCVGCRLEYSRQWAIRCMHEASLYQDNCFITLTYDNKHLPSDWSLNLYVFQCFLKRLRKKHTKVKIRYFHCGEYGAKFGRPHYHALLFNFDFNDKVYYKTERGHRLYISESLQKLWPYGFSTIGAVTFQSAAYVARYVMKKWKGKDTKEYYTRVDLETGELIELYPEYATMSRRNGIGSDWLKKYGQDVYPSDYVVVNGKKVKPPKYYDVQFSVEHPIVMEGVHFSRHQKALMHVADNTPERLQVKEKVLVSKLNMLRREIDETN